MQAINTKKHIRWNIKGRVSELLKFQFENLLDSTRVFLDLQISRWQKKKTKTQRRIRNAIAE